jgi:tetratricopeptide (TPR) repeat protein
MPAVASGAERACAAGDCERAIGLWEKAVVRAPADYTLHYRLGICYGGACRTHGMVHGEMAVSYLRQASRLTENSEKRGRAIIQEQLAGAICRGASPTADALRSAIECYREAAEIYLSSGMLADWARTQFNLGNTCCDLSELGEEEHWKEAVFHYTEALSARIREQDTDGQCAVLENLGTAYRRLQEGDSADNIRKSIQCYQRALRVRGTALNPSRVAALHNNLGNAFLSLPWDDQRIRERNAHRALRHFDRALQIESQNRSGRIYGITQYNRGQAYRILEDFDAALACLNAALAILQSCGDGRYVQLVRIQLDRLPG